MSEITLRVKASTECRQLGDGVGLCRTVQIAFEVEGANVLPIHKRNGYVELEACTVNEGGVAEVAALDQFAVGDRYRLVKCPP